jgi:hypothetical protein
MRFALVIHTANICRVFRISSTSSTTMLANSFLLCMCSPVLYKLLYGGFIEETSQKKLKLEDVDGESFSMALDIWCGKEISVEIGLEEIRKLASVADRFAMTEVVSMLDETAIGHLEVMGHLDISMCGELLGWSSKLGLRQSEKIALRLASERFEELVTTQGFMQMDEEALGKLLDDNNLAARSEEAVWEALVGWSGSISKDLIVKVRFPLMAECYLRNQVVGMVPAELADWMKDVVAEALRAKTARWVSERIHLALLGPKALDDRVGLGVRWIEYADGGGRRLKGHTDAVWAVAECEGRLLRMGRSGCGR